MNKLLPTLVALSLLVGCSARQSHNNLRVAISKAIAEVFDSEKGWRNTTAGGGGNSKASDFGWTLIGKVTTLEAEDAMRTFRERLKHDLGSLGAHIHGEGDGTDGFNIAYTHSSEGIVWAMSTECKDGQVKVHILWHAVF